MLIDTGSSKNFIKPLDGQINAVHLSNPFISKHDNGNPNHRLVIDFRKLNEQTDNDKYPMPEIPVLLSTLGRSSYFTTLDLKSGYHQI